jgi:sRNA-binding protein
MPDGSHNVLERPGQPCPVSTADNWPGYRRFEKILGALYPETFTRPRKPLATGIDRHLTQAFPDLEPRRIRNFLRSYTAKTSYLERSLKDAPRVGLDGKIAGQVTESQANRARRLLAKRRAVAQ